MKQLKTASDKQKPKYDFLNLKFLYISPGMRYDGVRMYHIHILGAVSYPYSWGQVEICPFL